MSEQYHNNPLHGLKLEVLLTELVDFYGWEILAAALNFNCFKLNPSIKGSLKFLRKTDWARHKIEGFYLYRFKHLPRPDDKQFALPPRDRIVPEDQKPRDPVVLTLEDLAQAQARKEKADANKKPGRPQRNFDKPKRSFDKRHDEDSSPSRSSYGHSTPKKPSQSNSNDRSSASQPSSDSFDPWGAARKNLENKDKND